MKFISVSIETKKLHNVQLGSLFSDCEKSGKMQLISMTHNL